MIKVKKELIKRILEWVGTPWDGPMSFAGGCKFCGKSYPPVFSNAEEHYDSCIYQELLKLKEKV